MGTDTSTHDSSGGNGLLIAFFAISLYNVIELYFIITSTFKTRKGLYFWSFVVATNGVAIFCIGFMLKVLSLSNIVGLYITFIKAGWVLMVTGQSFVLYSRLHLVHQNPFHLKLVLAMIIFDAFALHTPTLVLCGVGGAVPANWTRGYNIMENIEVTVFFLQELILSLIYIKSCFSFFRPKDSPNGGAIRKMRNHLLWVNLLVILLDITIPVLQYANLYNTQSVYKGLVYSVKLKVEFSILNKLVEITRGPLSNQCNVVYSNFLDKADPGLQPEPFDCEKRIQGSLQGQKDGNTVGYNASVKTEGGSDVITNPGERVIITTATNVDGRSDTNSKSDKDSVDITGGRTTPKMQAK